MSGSSIGALGGALIGNLIAPGIGAKWGFAIGSMTGGYVDPAKVTGPRLDDTQQQLSQEGAFIPFGYGTFPSPTQVVWQGPVVEHKKKSGGKGGGGVQQISYTYTRSYAIGVCEGEADVVKLWRNGKLVYDITPTSTITGNNAKWLAKCTFYRGDETQLVDSVIEAVEGVGTTGPMRGLCYFVVEDDETQAGEIAQYRAVVQKCGTRTTTLAENFVATSTVSGQVKTSAAGVSWASRTGGLTGVLLGYLAQSQTALASWRASTGRMYYSTDRGLNWSVSASGPFSNMSYMAQGGGVFVCAIWDSFSGVATTIRSTDGGVTWAAGGSIGTFVSIEGMYYYNGLFFCTAQGAGGGIYTSSDGITWTHSYSAGGITFLGFNGTSFLAGNTTTIQSTTGLSWTATGGAALAAQGFCIAAGAGFWVVGTGTAIYRSTDNAATWTSVATTGSPIYSSAYSVGGETIVFGSGGGGSNLQLVSSDYGVTWAVISPDLDDQDIVFVGPESTWYVVPDAPGVYADEDGVLQTGYVTGTQISACGAYLDTILADLCQRGGIASTEYDVTALASVFVKGYPCATEGSPQSFIEPLTQAFFFDRGEWDKKIRFIPRGGASAFALTADDLVSRDGPAIGQTKIQEVELLRKVSVITVDPAADYSAKPQVWERRSGTVQAKGESTVEIPIVTDADTAKQIAHKRSNVAWSETEKFNFGLTRKWSKLTPTDVGTLTDKKGAVHRVRIQDMTESNGVFMVEEAPKDRASAYTSTATGTVHTPPITTTPGLRGNTLFAAMALPMLRSSDNSPGFYVGACGILDGWQGCVVLMSVDGGLSYQTALTITEPTVMGTLTAACTASSTPIAVRVFGTLESATFLQVGLGRNWAAIASVGGTPEIIAYQTATSTGTRTYDLTNTYRGRDETLAAAHASGDQFMDLATAYFLPIPQAYAGGNILFKAVAIGVSQDAVDPVTVPFEGSDYIVDGGEVVGPLGLLDRAGAAIYDRAGQIINSRV